MYITTMFVITQTGILRVIFNITLFIIPRRDKTMNLFSVMVRNRVRNEEDKDANPDEEEKVKTKSKVKKEKDSFVSQTETFGGL